MKQSYGASAVVVLAFAGLFLTTQSTSAAPDAKAIPAAKAAPGAAIAVDSSEFSVGTIEEGTQDTVKHIFKIKNKGDIVLHISQVRPGCGCTVVQYDSIITPGHEGLLRATINIANLHGGEFVKGITITSNAANAPEMRVAVKGLIQTIIAASPGYIAMTATPKGPIAAQVILTTVKPDLKISDVNFITNTHNPVGWQSNLPLPIQFTCEKMESGKNDTESKYKLSLSIDFTNATSSYGDFVIKTNHPKKPELKISGMLPQTK